jgi:hypothetical protein
MSVRAVDGQRSFYHTDYLCRDLFGSALRGDTAPVHGESGGPKSQRAVVYHLGWKYALDLALDYDGFHATALVIFATAWKTTKLNG